MIGASFRHETSRALDPQLHSHCVLLNTTRRSDGESRERIKEELARLTFGD